MKKNFLRFTVLIFISIFFLGCNYNIKTNNKVTNNIITLLKGKKDFHLECNLYSDKITDFRFINLKNTPKIDFKNLKLKTLEDKKWDDVILLKSYEELSNKIETIIEEENINNVKFVVDSYLYKNKTNYLFYYKRFYKK